MAAEIDRLLNQGLEHGYAGQTQRELALRGEFPVEVSQYQSPEGGIYRDEWAANRAGGGQEIAKLGENVVTRLYAGGTIQTEQLQDLGLTKKDVTRRLKQFINGSEGKTRLGGIYAAVEGDWAYTYRTLEHIKEIPLTVGMETITYRGRLVFAHGFLHSPVD